MGINVATATGKRSNSCAYKVLLEIAVEGLICITQHSLHNREDRCHRAAFCCHVAVGFNTSATIAHAAFGVLPKSCSLCYESPTAREGKEDFR